MSLQKMEAATLDPAKIHHATMDPATIAKKKWTPQQWALQQLTQ